MPPSDVVLAFPGQGSLSRGVGAPWHDHACFSVVDQVSAASGVDVARLLLEADLDELASTRNAQLATYALSLAVLDSSGLAGVASTMLGHSLGEYTALVAAELVTRGDGARLVDARGAAMLAAADDAPGSLVAMIGGDLALATSACGSVDGLHVANLNGPGQIVLGGTVAAVAEVVERAKELGFRRAIPLRVGGAFHTPLMAPARPALRAALAATTFSEGRATVVANVDGAAHRAPGDWPDLLARQLTEPVDWMACVESLPADAHVVELGPGGVLTGLTRRIRADLTCTSVAAPEDLALIGGVR